MASMASLIDPLLLDICVLPLDIEGVRPRSSMACLLQAICGGQLCVNNMLLPVASLVLWK